LWTLGIWLFFSLITMKFYHKLTGQVYTIPKIVILRAQTKSISGRWLFYYFKTLVYTTIIFFGLRMKIDNFDKDALRHKGLFVYLIVVYVSGLVCLGFIANIIFG